MLASNEAPTFLKTLFLLYSLNSEESVFFFTRGNRFCSFRENNTTEKKTCSNSQIKEEDEERESELSALTYIFLISSTPNITREIYYKLPHIVSLSDLLK